MTVALRNRERKAVEINRVGLRLTLPGESGRNQQAGRLIPFERVRARRDEDT